MSASDDDGDSPHGQGRSRRSRAADELGLVKGAPAWCSSVWTIQPFQERVVACKNGIVFSVGGLGSGKSEASAALLGKWALRHPRRKDGNPTRWYVIGPEFGLIRLEQFPKILNHFRRLKEIGYGSLVRRVVYGQDPKIILRDGQIILGRSGDQYRRMEGNEVDGFWLDEGQRQPEMSFAIALSRLRSSDDIRATVSASPEDAPGWVWRFINGKDKRYNRLRSKLLRHGKGVRVFRWNSRVNKANEEGNLAIIGAALDAASEGAAAQKIGGRFPGTEEAPSVGLINYARAFFPELVLGPQDALPSTLGVDIGETDDFTWFTVLSVRGVVLYMERFNAGTPGVPRATFYPWLEARIEHVAKAWHVKKTVIDIAKAGKPIQQNLEAKFRGLKLGEVLGYDTGSGRGHRKAEIIESLALGLSRGDYRIPERWTAPDGRVVQVEHVGQLRKEFEEVYPTDHGGRRTWDHPKGGHDDGIVSLALAASVLSKGSPPGGLGGWKAPDGGKRWFS